MPTQIDNGSTAKIVLYCVLSSDHITPATGKTVAVTISKNGAAFGNPSGGATNATEIGSGWYYFTPSGTDTGTNGPLIVLGTSATIDNSTRDYVIAPPIVTSGQTITVTSGGVTLADGVAHGGTQGSSTATLALDSIRLKSPLNNALYISADLGDAVRCEGLHSGAYGLNIAGDVAGVTIYGNTYALDLQSDTCINMLNGQGNGLVGQFVFCQAQVDGVGFTLTSLNGDTIKVIPTGTNVHGVNIAGGTVSGDAVHKTATDGHGDFSQGGAGKAAVVPGTLAIGS